MKYNRRGTSLLSVGIIGLAYLGLQGCAASGQSEAQASLPAGTEQQVTFPEPNDAWVDEGAYVNLENLSRMQVGRSKDQIYDLLGRPHFSEGLFGVREWNYIFHLPMEAGGYMTCQYQVNFDDEMLAESLHWRESRCSALIEPEQDNEEPAEAHMTLCGDTLFDFDSAHLSSQGRQQVINLAGRIRDEFVAPQVMVIGHTDRLGSERYNLALSEKRALAVRSLLVEHGIASSAVRSVGQGERNPLTYCPGNVSPQLKQCLMPNRRVEVTVRSKP